MGRRTKLTDELQERLLQAIRAGNFQDTAARFAGLAPSTFYNWMKAGRLAQEKEATGEELTPEEYRLVEFLEAIEKARAEAEVRNLHLIQQAASGGTWQAAAWYLERSHPGKWARREKVEHSGPDGGPITLQGLADLMGVAE